MTPVTVACIGDVACRWLQ